MRWLVDVDVSVWLVYVDQGCDGLFEDCVSFLTPPPLLLSHSCLALPSYLIYCLVPCTACLTLSIGLVCYLVSCLALLSFPFFYYLISCCLALSRLVLSWSFFMSLFCLFALVSCVVLPCLVLRRFYRWLMLKSARSRWTYVCSSPSKKDNTRAAHIIRR